MSEIVIRYMRREDLDAVVECERLSHTRRDPDPEFGVPVVEPFAWKREDFLTAVRAYKSKADGTDDTRAYVAQVGQQVCGAYINSLEEDGYRILVFTASPEHAEGVREVMLQNLVTRAKKSPKRKRITIHVQDGDYATLKFFMGAGFTRRLEYNPAGNDTWHCELDVSKQVKQLTK